MPRRLTDDEDNKPGAWLRKANPLDVLAGYAVGASTFVVALQGYQRLVLRTLRIYAHQQVRGTVFGAIGVFAAGIGASLAMEKAAVAAPVTRAIELVKGDELKRDDKAFSLDMPSISSIRLPTLDDLSNLQSSAYDRLLDSQVQIVIYGTSAVVGFLVLRGQFRRLAPSHYFYPGAFAFESLKAVKNRYATVTEKTILREIGRQRGCHTCGMRSLSSNYIGDHIPPSHLTSANVTQRFYPQCPTCSSRQGHFVSLGSAQARTHSSLRMYHLWLPLGNILEYLHSHL